MKRYYTLLFIVLFVACSSFKPRYISNNSYNILLVIDSILIADNILIPDTSKWLKTVLITNQGVITNKLFFLIKGERLYIITVIDLDSGYHYKYRIE